LRQLRVIPVTSEAERIALLEFPWKVYRGDPYWVPPLLSERKAFTDPKQSPFFEHARVQFFRRRGDEIVGTIAAFTNDLYNEFQRTNVGWLVSSKSRKMPKRRPLCWSGGDRPPGRAYFALRPGAVLDQRRSRPVGRRVRRSAPHFDDLQPALLRGLPRSGRLP
jgi:hypothetical protein